MRIALTRPGTDKVVRVDIEPTDSIEEVKRKARASDPKLKFIFDGRLIKDGCAVSEYGVQEDSVLCQATLLVILVERREEFFVDLAWTVGTVKTLARTRLTLDADADIQLFAGKELLDNDELSLQQAGVVGKQMLRLLSRAVAEEHGLRSKVYKTGLAEELRGGAAECHGDSCSKEPFPLDCKVHDLAELGPGWPLFFEFGYFLAGLSAVLFVLQLPVLVLYARSSGMQLWPASITYQMEHGFLLSAGNLGPHGCDWQLPGWCAHFCCLVVLVAATAYGRRQSTLKRQLDFLEVEPMDFAVLVYGMPGQALDFWTDEARVRGFLENCLGGSEHVEVAQVVLGYDAHRLQALIKDYQNLAQCTYDGADGRAPLLTSSLSQEEIQQILTTPERLREELPCHACCIVVLRSPVDQRRVLEKWATGWEQALWLLRGACSILKAWSILDEELTFSGYSRLPQIDDRHPVCIRRARAPSDLLWLNFGATFVDCFWARLKTHAGMVLIFAIGFLVIWGVESLAGGRIGGAWWQVLLRCLVLVMVNIVASSYAKSLSEKELHLTKTDQDDSLMVKLSIYMVVNYTFLLIALYWDPGSTWYRVGGLLGTICVLMPTDTMIISLMAYYGIGSRLGQFITGYWTPEPLSAPGMTQAQLNRVLEPKEMNISRPFSHLVKSFLMCMFFLPFWPLGSLWMVLSLVLKTRSYKKQLLRDSKCPYRQSHVIAFSALNFVYVGALLYSFSAWWFLTPSLKGRGEDALSWFTPLLSVAAVYLLAAPRWANNFLAGLLLPWLDYVLGALLGDPTAGVAEGSSLDSHDYYSVQRHWHRGEKYYTASPVYQQLDRAMRAQRVQPPWDPDGNLKEPSAA